MAAVTNKDTTRRAILLGIPLCKKDQFCRFEGLDFTSLAALIEEGFADAEDSQNEAPTVGEILKFLAAHPKFTCYGYAVNPDREDYRVSIEGVKGPAKVSKKDLVDFVEMFRLADEFEVDPPYAWYD